MPTLLMALATLSLAQAEVSPQDPAHTVEAPAVKEVEKKGEPNFPASSSARRFEVNTGASFGMRPASATTFGGTGTLGISFRVLSFLRPEVVLGYGLFDGPFDLVTIIRAGLRGELPLNFPVRPYVWVAFAHNHEVPMDMVALHPVESLLGTSEHGTHHRTGIEFGGGVSWDVVQFREAAVGLRAGLRATAAIFLGTGPAYGDLSLTLGTTF
jgi:hypothetical protein